MGPCGADVDSVLGRVAVVRVLVSIFRDMEAASGLGLHSGKGIWFCVCVPLVQGASGRLCRPMSWELRRCSPECEHAPSGFRV